MSRNGSYERYHIETQAAPDIVPWPSRFQVKVNRPKLAQLLIQEFVEYGGDLGVVLSRPCVYGVFSGPIGGFAPRERLCVGCLRCTTQYPEMVKVLHNPERQRLGDSYFTSPFVNAISYEAATGRVPVRGAGYRGRFGGEGWDGMWTDMSEIVRPTRDGIHGREYISTAVDVGTKLGYLTFDQNGGLTGDQPEAFYLAVPFLFDRPPAALQSETLAQILAQAAGEIRSLAILPLDSIETDQLAGRQVVPLVSGADKERLNGLSFRPTMMAMDGWDPGLHRWLKVRFPDTHVALRTGFEDMDNLLDYHAAGIRIFHLVASYHGRTWNDDFVHDAIRTAHKIFVQAAVRDEVTLIGGGGMIAAEHVPKAIIAGLDAVALDTAPLVALQAWFYGECVTARQSKFKLPDPLPVGWGVQRLKNMSAAWRDQLLEVLGAMGLREVRRLRGETGRVMYQRDLELEAFAGIEGYHV